MVKAQLSDASVIFNLLAGAQSNNNEFNRFGLSWTIQKVKSALIKGGGWLCFEKQKLTGALLFTQPALDVHEIQLLLVSPDYHKRGFGSGLIQAYKNGLNQQGFQGEVWLELHEENIKALEFYKAQGFQVVGKRRKYYSDGGAALLMSLQVL